MSANTDPGGFPQRRVADVPVVTVAQMREIQRAAQEDAGYDILQILENAGRSVAALALAMLGGRGRGERVVVLAGGGNKGGAGLCAARHLVNWGFSVEVVYGEVEGEGSFAARRQHQVLRNSGIIDPGDVDSSEITVEDHLNRADLVIDALIGYGLEGAPAGIAAALIELASEARRPILAIDVPTGVSAATGEVHTPSIKAGTTLILDLPKTGMLEARCRPCVGALYLADIGIPRTVHERLGIQTGSVFHEGPVVRIRR